MALNTIYSIAGAFTLAEIPGFNWNGYIREYRTYFHISKSYGVSESTAYKTVRWVEETLIKHPDFALPGRKALLKSDMEYEVVLVDASETPIERPKKRVRNKKRVKNRNNKQKHFYSGKKKRHTLKSQIE